MEATQQTETAEKTTTETPAPVAETPAIKEAPAAAPVAATEKQKAGDTKPKPADYFNQREAKREKKASERLSEVEKELADLKAAKTKADPEQAPISFLDDPEAALRQSKEDAKREVFAELQNREAEAQRNYEFRQENEKAASWLLTRSHLKEDREFLKEVAGIIEDKYARILAVDPAGASRLAYLDACAAKGVTPDIEGFVSAGFDGTKGNATSGARPSAAATGKRVFAKGEGQKYIYEATPGSDEFRKRIDEVEEAQRDGRIK